MTRFGQEDVHSTFVDALAEPPAAVVAIGGSAGSLSPLRQLVAELPVDLPAAVLVAIHRGERTPSHLAEILSRAGPLPAGEATDGEPIRAGRIYVAPPGRHLLSGYGRIRLSGAPRVNRHRPAIDVLFASVARWSAGRTVAVMLSGVLDDGAVGAALVAQAGGRVLVQDPKEADFASMPAAALAAAPGARPVPVADLAGGVLDEVEAVVRSDERPTLHIHGVEVGMEMPDSDDPGFLAEEETKLTRLVCPECGGSLAQVELSQISYFRCHIGHQYAPQTLAAAQAEAAEAKLWSAVAALEEQATFQHYLGNLGSIRPGQATGQYARSAERTAARAAALRDQVRQWMADAAATAPSTD